MITIDVCKMFMKQFLRDIRKEKMKIFRISILIAVIAFCGYNSHSQLIGKASNNSVVLENAEIYTVTKGVVAGSVWLQDGKIKAVGKVDAPTTVERIDCQGKRVYPGFIDSGTSLGLKEIGSISLTQDAREIGEFHPQMDALTAVNPNSVLIPVTRVNGITSVLAVPEGGYYCGQANLINLWGYTPDQMDANFKGLVINYPSTGKKGWWDRRSPEEIKKESEKALKKFTDYWEKAVAYQKIYEKAKGEVSYNPELEAMRLAVEGKMKVLIECNSKEDILAAIKWVGEIGIDAILTGVKEGYMVADSIAKSGLPVVTGPVLAVPSRSSEAFDVVYKNAGVMQKAGIEVALRTDDNENVRNLLYNAGFAAAYGMGIEEAVKAITIVPARLFGLDDMYGSIEAGKVANLFICDGDPFETKTTIEQVFINGWKIPMESRHTLLYDEFLERNPGLQSNK